MRLTGVSRTSRHRGVGICRLPEILLMLLAAALSACATRSPQPEMANSQATLKAVTSDRLISAWQQALGRFISRNGHADPAVLSETQFARSRDVLRPARITFGVLDVEASLPGKDGWDVTGVLVGNEVIGDRSWYVFTVGVVERSGYRPASLVDVRVVGLSIRDRKPTWRTGRVEPQAVQRYREAFAATGSVRFPADADAFTMKLFEERVSISELRSGAQWSLPLDGETSI
jgi:hypothetical protein